MSVQTQAVTGHPDEAFGDFYRTYHPQLLRFVIKQFGWEDAEEITSETMARALVHYDNLHAEGGPWPWLTVTARRIGIDLWRRRRPCRPVDATELAVRASAQPGPDDVLLAAEQNALVRTAIGRLSPKQQQFIKLRYLEDMSYADMSALLARTETAVRQQVCRAKARLHSELLKLEGRASALFPVAAVMAGIKALRDKTTAVAPATATAGVPLAVLGAAVLGIGAGVLALAPQDPAAALHGARTASARVTISAPPPAGVVRTVAPAARGTKGPVPAPAVREGAAPVSLALDLDSKPFAPGARRQYEIAVPTPVGTVRVSGVSQNSEQTRVVCEISAVDCR